MTASVVPAPVEDGPGSRFDVGKATAVVLPGGTGEAHSYGASGH
ncbi:hypothetical protein [Pseudarthrobacter sp. NamE5]|nr:hypothetical protein [Pseudarthrobacter sp. NamE5]